jgi:hypothetical protein
LVIGAISGFSKSAADDGCEITDELISSRIISTRVAADAAKDGN